MRCLLAAAFSLLAAPASADYIAYNRMIAAEDPTRAGVIEVYQKAGAGPVDYWCAAGDYARRAMGRDGSDRLYLLRPLGQSNAAPRRSSVAFTIVPYPEVDGGSRPGDGGSYSVPLDVVGYNLRTLHARAFCPDSLKRFRRLGLAFP
ncbi:hypothetical protein RM543_09085 [Roseicyclus sp. F158]|uniref:Uncharacterized protein n=1 Tax=Tropicimonas omnivorans TaxID=3075590 RepID=A0ABU3DGJ3_9RHOB|nr:hypothetical protein [Roseicyclus sp. F158]MDT0682838.1 hypothetical protein [Roseicyclus sp. F158]